MHDERPGHFTLIDLLWELFHVGCVAAGCYAGWKIGEHFLALFAGGIVGRMFGVRLVLGLKSRFGRGSGG